MRSRSSSSVFSLTLPLAFPKVNASSFIDVEESAKRATDPVKPDDEEANSLLGLVISSNFSKMLFCEPK